MKHSPKDPQGLLQAYLDDLLTAPSETAYADPVDDQRERLQKLLYSAATPLKAGTVTSAKTQTRPAQARSITRPVVVEPKVSAPTIEPTTDAPAARVTPQPRVKLAEPLAPEVPENDTAETVPTPSAQELMPEPEAGQFRLKDVEWLVNGRPVWAQERFDVLLFKVSGLTLAVPLIALGQIQPLTDELTPLFGQADWFMGLLPTPTGKIRTVNTARFVMPERYDERFVETAEYVISIDGVPWGLAVDSVNQPISLDPEDVKWRTERSRRPWLAGTVKEHMCALLDIPRIGQLLMEADRKRA
ncbi:chemotaxis protein CheW [Marinimicrobium sp. C6131]|uniref:chemotaxis protein CheW n=1 Tax=Marinimicrobium sp. C6131 TaxID=3022676 RepID=UPI00223D0481|nr:chemotaxis protein CheW [Marinimicrobium sp. C6131]UZJ45250.1 chemotaxis protein CheW [Marinimicrobium sp. C6131]